MTTDTAQDPSCVRGPDVLPLDAIGGLRAWDAAVAASGAPVFYSSAFLASIAAAPLLPVESSSLVLVEGADGAVAGVPVFLQARIDPLRHLARLHEAFPDLPSSTGLLGHCWHCYDSRIVSPGAGGALAPVAGALRALARASKADYFGLVNVSDRPTLDAMAAAGLTPRYMVDRYQMDLAGYTAFDDYVAALPPDSRRELRRQYRRFHESAATLAIERPPFADVDEVVRLCRDTAARYDALFYYPDGPTRRLLETLGDALRLVSIRHAGERVGVLVCFFDPPRFHVWAAGMRYDRTAFSPYAVGIAEAIRFAIASGMTMVEGGRGNGRIKRKQGFVPLPLYACLQRA